MIASAAMMPLLVALLLGQVPNVGTTAAPTNTTPTHTPAQSISPKPPLGFPERVERSAEQPAPTIRFSRILAPLDRMKDWPTDGGKYLPMDAAEFERMVNLLKTRDASNRPPPPASITSARYEARLVGDRLIGKAVWDVVLSRDGPAMLPLEPCGAAISDARWQNSPLSFRERDRVRADNINATKIPTPSPPAPLPEGEGSISTVPAVMGLRADDLLALLVERSGRLEFNWSLAARRESGAIACFAFEMPGAALNRLSIDLPDDCTPSVDRGIVLGGTASGERTRRWLIELPRLGRINLHIVPAGASVGRPLALLRESRTYDCSLRGLDVAAQWKLQVHNEPLDKITLLLDPGLRLVSAQLGDIAIPWSIDSTAEGGETHVELRLPEPIRDAERIIRLGAIGPAVLGQRWRLPRIRSEGLFWQEGNLTILTPEPLSADRVEPVECVQMAAGPLSAPREGRTAQFQCFNPNATVEVLLARRPTKARLLSVTKIELGEDSAAARIAAELHIAGGARSTITSDLSPQWTVDAVDSIPAGNVADWTSEPLLDGRQRLTFQLTEALGPQRSTRLKITCRRRFESKTEKLRQTDLSPLLFRDIDNARRLTAVRAASGNTMEIAGGEQLRCLSIDDLTEAEQALFALLPDDQAWGGDSTTAPGRQYNSHPNNDEMLIECDGQAKSLEIGLRSFQADPPPLEKEDAVAAAVPDNPTAAAWVWNLRLESWYQNNATSRHLATYKMQSVGRRNLDLTLPPNVSGENVRGVWLDGELAVWQTIDGNRVSVKLPAERKDPRVAIEWTTIEPRLGVSGKLSAVAPEPDSTVLARQWIVRLPPGLEIADPRGGEPTAAAPQGWTAWRIDFSDAAPPELRYIRRDSFRLFGVVAFLLVVAVGCWRRDMTARNGRSMTFSLIVLAAFSTSAVFLPYAFTAPAWGGMIGVVFCLAWRFTRTSRPVEIEPPRRPRSTSDSTITMLSPFEPLGLFLILAVVVAVSSGGTSLSALPDIIPDTPLTTEAVAPVYRVIVPIDAEQKPTGGKVFLPERFYRKLHRLAASADKPPAWMIVGAVYRGELARDTTAGRLVVGNISTQYDLHVFEPSARVRLPLGSERSALLAGSVRLDGRAVETIRDADAAPSIEIAEPGQYRLELSLRPTARSPGALGGFELSIPRIPDARFELALPEGAPAVEVASARGNIQLGEGARRLSAELGPTDRLTVQWQEDAAQGGIGHSVEVEQLAWLKIQPGSVLVAVRFHFNSVEGRIQQMRLAVDHRLRLLPILGDNPPSVQLGAESGAARIVTLRWPRPLVRDTTIETAFLLGGASGVGNVPLPKIEPLDFTPVINWIAVVVDPTLDYDQQQETPLESVAAADFLQAWGKSESTPQFAFRMPDNQTGWTLSTRPHQPRGTVDQSLALGFGEDRVEVVFEAVLSVASGYVFQHRLTVPKELKVESVSVLENDIEQVQRWSLGDDDAITVFLGGPASASQKLTVQGSLPLEMNRPWPLPVFRVERCDLHSATIRLHRRPGVLLNVQGEEGEQFDVTTAVGTIRPGTNIAAVPFDLGRLARTIRWDGSGQPSAEVVVHPNRPRIIAEQILWLQDEGGLWSARTKINLKVTDGIVDEITLRAPSPWNGPYKADQPGELLTRDIPGRGRCIVFRPVEQVSADYSLTVSGPLELTGDERLCVPDIRPVGFDVAKRTVELPRRTGNRTYRWRTQGLQAVGCDSSRPTPTASDNRRQKPPPTTDCYTISGKSFRACLESVKGGSASVELADVALTWSDDGRLRGAARLNILPGGSVDCTLRLPKGCELLEALIEGRPATASRLKDSQWRVRLTSSDAPQMLEIVFIGNTSCSGNLCFDAPTLIDVPVHRVRWTIGVPAGRLISDPQAVTAVEPWTPDDFLLQAIGSEKTSTLQFASPSGDASLTLGCRPAAPNRLARYLAAAVALTALGLLVLRRKR